MILLKIYNLQTLGFDLKWKTILEFILMSMIQAITTNLENGYFNLKTHTLQVLEVIPVMILWGLIHQYAIKLFQQILNFVISEQMDLQQEEIYTEP